MHIIMPLILYHHTESSAEMRDNILWVDEQVMIIDFEQVKFDALGENSNSAAADSLMLKFKRTCNPDRLSSYRLLSANRLC